MSNLPPRLNPSFDRALRYKRAPRPVQGGCAEYEQRKAEWIARHPDATPVQYDTAMNRIARECRV